MKEIIIIKKTDIEEIIIKKTNIEENSKLLMESLMSNGPRMEQEITIWITKTC